MSNYTVFTACAIAWKRRPTGDPDIVQPCERFFRSRRLLSAAQKWTTPEKNPFRKMKDFLFEEYPPLKVPHMWDT